MKERNLLLSIYIPSDLLVEGRIRRLPVDAGTYRIQVNRGTPESFQGKVGTCAPRFVQVAQCEEQAAGHRPEEERGWETMGCCREVHRVRGRWGREAGSKYSCAGVVMAVVIAH